MMKSIRLLLLCLCLVLLFGCQSPVTPPVTTVPTTAPTEPTVPPTTVPAEPEWLVSHRVSPDYDAFFSQDLPYHTSPYGWMVPGEGTLSQYYLRSESSGLYVSMTPWGGGKPIPHSDSLGKPDIVGADGRWAYVLQPDGILQVDMVSGETALFVPHSGIIQAELCGYDVLYYAAVADDDTIGIYRLYIPTMTLDVLHEGIDLDPYTGRFRISFPASTLGSVTWSCIHPDMMARLKAELADPNSPYKQGKGNFAPTHLWENPDLLEDPNAFQDTALLIVCHWIQEDTRIPSWYKCTYDCATGTLSEDTGVLDGCWYGTGFPHDHYEPEVTSLPAPEIAIGPWQSIQDATLPDYLTADALYAEKEFDHYSVGLPGLVIQGQPLQPEYPCHPRGNILIPVTDFPVTMAVQTVYFLYCVTDSSTIVQLSHDGAIQNVLYTAQSEIHQISYAFGHLYILDGNTLVDIDIPNLRYRTVLTNENLREVEAYEEPGAIYFAIGRGLYYQQYLLYPETGILEETYII